MSVAQTKAARRKMIARYGDPSKRARSVASALEAERRKAAREAAYHSRSSKKKK